MEVHTLKNRDSAAGNLQQLLEAQLSCERMVAARSLIAHLLAITGAVIWLEAIWPGLVNPEIRFFAVAVFGGNLILALGVTIEEVIWRIRLKRRLDANQAGGA